MTAKAEMTAPGRRAVLAALLAAFLPGRVPADLRGRQEIRIAVAGKTDDALIAANPVLERLARRDPALLHEVLGRLRTPPPSPSHRRTLAQDQPEPPTAAEHAVLAENPDLAGLYRESPEAALDLLRLIREAAKRQ